MLWWMLAAASARPVAEVTSIDAADAPQVDGRLDDVAWSRATPVTDFVRYTPEDGPPPEGTTEVWFLQDEDHLYVGIRVTGSPMPIRARVGAREEINSDDQIGLYLDPFDDAQTGYIFYTNPLGVQQDIRWTAGQWNQRWNTVYRTKGTVHEDGRGFDLEIALPFQSLRFPAGGGERTWGVILTRKIPGEGAKYSFPHLSRNHPWLFAQSAALEGVRPPQQAASPEIIPGLTGRVEGSRADLSEPLGWSDLDPWYDVVRPSLDARVGLTPNLTLIGSVNPDFSEVEEDVTPTLLNRRFAFQFSERRPFFTEGEGFFSDRHGTLYSRSLVQPMYGIKLAGREGRWSTGILHVLDRQPAPSVHERGSPGFAPEDVEGRWSIATMARLRRDLPRRGWIGITVADKHLVPAGLAPPDPWDAPRAGHDDLGLDLSLPIGRQWVVSAGHAQSMTYGRGDFLGGSSTGVSLSRPSGDGLGASVFGGFTSRDFRQELGFRTQSGFGNAAASASWTFTPDVPIVSQVTPSASASVFEEIQGENYRSLSSSLDVLLAGVHRLTLSGGVDSRSEGADRPEGLQTVRGWNAQLSYSGQVGAALELRPTVSYGRAMSFATLAPARRLLGQLDLTLRPVRPLRFDLLGRILQFGDEGEVPGLDGLVRGRLQVQFTRELGLRLISELNTVPDRAPQLRSSALFSWILHPFTTAYVGYAERAVFGPEQGGALERVVYGKVQVMWRPRIRRGA